MLAEMALAAILSAQLVLLATVLSTIHAQSAIRERLTALEQKWWNNGR
jgi:hypothetical protein